MRSFVTVAASWLLAASIGNTAASQTILDAPPASPDPRAQYLFYLHGRAVELHGPEASTPKDGAYEYRRIVERLAGRGHVVIAELRGPETDADTYADKLAAQVRALLAAGVPASHVSIVGFSKGGFITLLTSQKLQNRYVNFVALAGCFGDVAKGTEPRTAHLKGRILSLVDYKDELCRPCATLFARNRSLGQHKEIILHDGRGHGYFFKAEPAWIDAALDWAVRR